jgi:hypothetical protein
MLLSSKFRRWWNRKVPSRLWFLNFLLLQWFTLRLAYVIDRASGKRLHFKLLLGVVPLTGWWSPYRWIWRS